MLICSRPCKTLHSAHSMMQMRMQMLMRMRMRMQERKQRSVLCSAHSMRTGHSSQQPPGGRARQVSERQTCSMSSGRGSGQKDGMSSGSRGGGCGISSRRVTGMNVPVC